MVLQQLDLVAHRRLGHAQLLAGAGETHVPGGGLEDAQGIERELFRQLHG